MPLNLAELNREYEILKVCGNEKQKHYLESLGFTAGGHVQVLSKIHGYYITRIRESKIGLEKYLAQRVILRA